MVEMNQTFFVFSVIGKKGVCRLSKFLINFCISALLCVYYLAYHFPFNSLGFGTDFS